MFQARLIEVVKEAVARAEAEARTAGHPPDAAAIAALTKAVMKKVGSLYEKDGLGLMALVLSGDDPDDPVAAAIKASPDPLLVGVLKELQVGLSLLRRGSASSRASRPCTQPSGRCRARDASTPSTASATWSSPRPTASRPTRRSAIPSSGW